MDQEIGILKKQAVKARKEHGIIEDGELTCKTESSYNTNRLAFFNILLPAPTGAPLGYFIDGVGGRRGGGFQQRFIFYTQKNPYFF